MINSTTNLFSSLLLESQIRMSLYLNFSKFFLIWPLINLSVVFHSARCLLFWGHSFSLSARNFLRVYLL
jgi:hypothetical protein